ncbi:iron chaperone [Occallatibacter savannae]|uniref:iron chaperone n=1 Tax=Occallatibacter savannae TaxID=1002691 RepID=UPI000D699095|nr:DUF1801 domain-containing protein [Occallatibacter savannae]
MRKTPNPAAPKAKLADSADGVDAYLANVPEPARTTLQKVRATIRSAAPKDATEGISYGMPAFRYKGALVGYAAFKSHCSFFPMQASLIDEMKEELKNYRTAKGTLQFPQDKPLPAALLKKMVKLRVAENEIRSATKGRKS